MSHNSIPEIISAEITKLKTQIQDRDIYIYYGSTSNKTLSAKAEMNKEDALFIEHQTKTYAPANSKAILILHTNGGFLDTAITLIDHLRKFYKDNVSVVVCDRAMSAGTFLALSLNCFYMAEEAKCSDFNPVEGIKSKNIDEFKLFVSQFTETVFKYIGNGLLTYRSSDDCWSAVNQISPFLFNVKSSSHTQLNFKEIHETIDEIKPLSALGADQESVVSLHKVIIDEMTSDSLSKILIINGKALVD